MTVDDSEAGADPLSTNPDSGRDVVDGGPDTATIPEPPDGSFPPDPGTCAAYTPGFDAIPGGGHVGSGGVIGCNVAVAVIDEAGSPKLVFKEGTSGTATRTDDVFRLSCDDGASVLMAATIRCFKGPGSYDVPAGALVLGGRVSDRRCRLDADTTEGQLRGFISCDKQPADPTNPFANTAAPIGLGTYGLLVK
ncbi:MAG TPA: hypothetical protein VLT33_39045 [Labilithrix sp.]|nr:hypothetical protein [Labilithrix sp.]